MAKNSALGWYGKAKDTSACVSSKLQYLSCHALTLDHIAATINRVANISAVRV